MVVQYCKTLKYTVLLLSSRSLPALCMSVSTSLVNKTVQCTEFSMYSLHGSRSRLGRKCISESLRGNVSFMLTHGLHWVGKREGRENNTFV